MFLILAIGGGRLGSKGSFLLNCSAKTAIRLPRKEGGEKMEGVTKRRMRKEFSGKEKKSIFFLLGSRKMKYILRKKRLLFGKFSRVVFFSLLYAHYAGVDWALESIRQEEVFEGEEKEVSANVPHSWNLLLSVRVYSTVWVVSCLTTFVRRTIRLLSKKRVQTAEGKSKHEISPPQIRTTVLQQSSKGKVSG